MTALVKKENGCKILKHLVNERALTTLGILAGQSLLCKIIFVFDHVCCILYFICLNLFSFDSLAPCEGHPGLCCPRLSLFLFLTMYVVGCICICPGFFSFDCLYLMKDIPVIAVNIVFVLTMYVVIVSYLSRCFFF